LIPGVAKTIPIQSEEWINTTKAKIDVFLFANYSSVGIAPKEFAVEFHHRVDISKVEIIGNYRRTFLPQTAMSRFDMEIFIPDLETRDLVDGATGRVLAKLDRSTVGGAF